MVDQDVSESTIKQESEISRVLQDLFNFVLFTAAKKYSNKIVYKVM